MKLFWNLLLMLLITTCALIPTEKNEYLIELSPDSLDKFEMYPGGAMLGPSKSSSRYHEEIKKLPDSFIVKYQYNICLQSRQHTYQKLLKSVEERERYFSRVTDEKFEDWQVKYTQDSLDCIVSLCSIEDSSGNKYMVFDQNNDEDLTNDPVIVFQTRSVYYEDEDTTIEFTYIDSDVQFEYYDGSSIKNGNYRIRLHETGESYPGLLVQSSASGNFGQAKIDGEKYFIGLINHGDIEYTKYDYLWIDINRNKKHDTFQDYYGQMYLPFTLGKRSFLVKEIDRFGKSLTLLACDPDSIPSIAVGLPAPDFIETSIDSVVIKLSDFAGKYVVLDFWTCSGNTRLPFTNNIYQEFKDNTKVGIVSFGPYTPEYFTSEVKEIKVNWPHIHGLFELPTRNLYQVGGPHTTFLISPKGIILAKKVFPSEEDLIGLINEYID